MLEVLGVTKKFNGVPVVKNVSFSVKPGEIVGYLGPNGAGKTTTVRMLAGLLRPGKGGIFYKGCDIEDDLAVYKQLIGYIPEQGELYSHLTGLEYLQLVGCLRRIPEETLNKKIGGILEQMGISMEMHLSIAGYSKGMRQKILIAAAILHDPEILLLDEPLSGLDVSTTLLLKDLLRLFSAQGKIIIYSSHILEVVEKVCNRVLILNEGSVLVDDSVDRLNKLSKLPSLEKIFRTLVQKTDTRSSTSRIVEMMSLN